MPTLPARAPQRSTPYYLLEMLGYWLYWRSRPLLDARRNRGTSRRTT